MGWVLFRGIGYFTKKPSNAKWLFQFKLSFFLLQRLKSLYSKNKEEIKIFYERQETFIIHQKHVMTGIWSIWMLRIYIITKVGFRMEFFRIPNPDPRDSWSGFLISGWIEKSCKSWIPRDPDRNLTSFYQHEIFLSSGPTAISHFCLWTSIFHPFFDKRGVHSISLSALCCYSAIFIFSRQRFDCQTDDLCSI